MPELPIGGATVTLIHADYAPSELKDLAVGGDSTAEAVLARGIKLSLNVRMAEAQPMVEALMIDLRHEPFEHPSTLIGRLPACTLMGPRGSPFAGQYSWLRLTHPDYIATPTYAEIRGRDLADTSEPLNLQPGSDRFTFQLLRKVKVRGRVLEEATGKPISNRSVQGELLVSRQEGPWAGFASEWAHADWGETNEEGEYMIQLAAGQARISSQGQGYFTRSEHYPLKVHPNGSTVAPDLLVAPLPKLRGVVQNAQGQPLPGAIVRFRGSMLTYGCQPIATDEQGRFELTPPWIPIDLRTEERKPLQTVVAFDPYHPLCTRSK